MWFARVRLHLHELCGGAYVTPRNRASPAPGQLSFLELFVAAEVEERVGHLPGTIEDAVPYYDALIDRYHDAVTLLAGFELGVNLVHTAPDYGRAEEVVAEAVAASGRKIIVASQGFDVPLRRTGRARLFEDQFEATCRRLRSDRLDLFGIACIDDREAYEENVWGLDGMVEYDDYRQLQMGPDKLAPEVKVFGAAG